MGPHDHSHDHSKNSNTSFWLFFNAGYKLLMVMSIFMQTSSIFDAGIRLFWDELPLLPVVNRTTPGIGLGATLSICVTLGSVVTDWRANFLIQHHDELDAYLKENSPASPQKIAGPAVEDSPFSGTERHDSSGGESNYLGELEAQGSSTPPLETTHLVPKKTSSCCLRVKPCCPGITLNQKAFFAGDVLNHVLEKTGPIFLIWFSLKTNLWSSFDSSFLLRAIEAGVNLGAILVGIPASISENTSTLISLQKYQKLLLFKAAAAAKGKDSEEALIKEVASPGPLR